MSAELLAEVLATAQVVFVTVAVEQLQPVAVRCHAATLAVAVETHLPLAPAVVVSQKKEVVRWES